MMGKQSAKSSCFYINSISPKFKDDINSPLYRLYIKSNSRLFILLHMHLKVIVMYILTNVDRGK